MRTSASFRLIGPPALPASLVTETLSIVPSRFHEAGDARSVGSRPKDSSIWILKSSDAIEDGVELTAQLQRLLQVLEPVKDALWDLVDKGYRANWFCYIGLNAAEHASELDRDTLARVLLLPGDLWLDVGS